MAARKKLDVAVRRPDAGKRAARIIRWVEEDGGFAMPCGHFVGASSADLRHLVYVAGPQAVVDVAVYINQEHESCK